MFQKPEGMLVATALLFGFIFLFIITSPLRNLGGAREPVSQPAAGENQSVSPPPFQAFRPREPRVETLPPAPPPPPSAREAPGGRPSFKELSYVNDIVFPANLVPPKPSELLELPAVPESELALDPNGVRSAAEYAAYFRSHLEDIKFSHEKLQSALRDDAGIIRMPDGLVEEALRNNTFERAINSLITFKELIAAKINYLKSIKVSDKAIGVNQTMIGLDRLTLALIENAIKVHEGTLAASDLEDFLKKYKTTARHWNRAFGKENFILPLSKSSNPLYALLGVFGLRNVAYALGAPFGGYIGARIPCECIVETQAPIPGSVIVVAVTPPPYSGNYYLSVFQEASPLLAAGVSAGAWIIGFQIPAPGVPVCGLIIPSPYQCFFKFASQGDLEYAGSGRR